MCSATNVSNVAIMPEVRIKSGQQKLEENLHQMFQSSVPYKIFQENVKRAHFQCDIWKRTLQEPPHLDSQYGWSRDEERKSSSYQVASSRLHWFTAHMHERLHATQVNVDCVAVNEGNSMNRQSS